MTPIKVLGEQIIPSASRLMKSLRNMGYDFSQAVADLVDNSIEAGASTVKIDVEFDGDHSRVRIADNGVGMNPEHLKEAMRYGSERLDDTEEGLGKFGLGLKTASLSQCQKLSVATVSNYKAKDFHAYCWDMTHVEKTNKWELVIPENKELTKIVRNRLSDSTGTVILWEYLDRMLGFKHPYGEFARKNLLKMCRELEEHLAMVFHRYLAGEVPGKDLKIFLNDNPVVPWDPFARSEAKTQVLDRIEIRLLYEGVAGNIVLQPYVLPHQSDFSSPNAFSRASGPLKWNQQQGFYVYRANRLIQSGGWSRIRTVDEHTKLARVGLSFSPHLDDAFKINVAKMRVQIPETIQLQISNMLIPIIKLAEDTYRRKDHKAQPPKSSVSSPNQEKTKSGQSSTTVKSNPASNKDLWTLDELEAELKSVAYSDEQQILSKVFSRLKKKLTK